jgi:uncharacterized protein
MTPLLAHLRLTLAGLLLLAACRDSKPLPPGDWLGRCAANGVPDKAVEFGPPPTRFVRDEAQIMQTAFVTALDSGLNAFQVETCHQITVVSVASLEGSSTLAEYSVQYANRIGLGYRRLNNGLLLVLAPSTRQARIQIGCGLEDVVSDAQANEILQRDLLPALREGYTQEGVLAATSALMKLAKKKTIAEEFRPEGCRKKAGGK